MEFIHALQFVALTLNILVQDEDPSVRAEVAMAIRHLSIGDGRKRKIFERNSTSYDRVSIFYEDTDFFQNLEARRSVAHFVFFEMNSNPHKILDVLAKDSIPEVRRSVVRSASFTNDLVKKEVEERVRILKILVKDSDPTVRREVALSAVRLGSGMWEYSKAQAEVAHKARLAVDLDIRELSQTASAKILNTLMYDSAPEVRSYIPFVIFDPWSHVQEGNRFKGLQAMAADKHPSVRKAVAENVIKLQDLVKAGEILNLFINDPDLEVIHQVIETARYLGQETAHRIIAQVLNHHSDLEIRRKSGDYVRSNFPNLYSQIESAGGGCEARFTN